MTIRWHNKGRGHSCVVDYNDHRGLCAQNNTNFTYCPNTVQ